MNHTALCWKGLQKAIQSCPCPRLNQLYMSFLTYICMASITQDPTNLGFDSVKLGAISSRTTSVLIYETSLLMSKVSMVQLKAYNFTCHFPCTLKINLSSFSLQAVKCFNRVTTLTSPPSGAHLGNYSVQEFIKVLPLLVCLFPKPAAGSGL